MDSDTMTRHPPKEWRQNVRPCGIRLRLVLRVPRWDRPSLFVVCHACPHLERNSPPAAFHLRHGSSVGNFCQLSRSNPPDADPCRNARSPSMNKTSKSFFFLAALSAIAAALILQSLDNAQASPGDRPAATYSGGTLRVVIPFRGLHPGAGQLTVEVLDPEDGVLGRAQRRVDVAEGAGSWREEITLDKAPSLDDMVWHRVRYRF